MWQVSGNPIEPGLFKPFEPVEILYDFDGPRTFTNVDPALSSGDPSAFGLLFVSAMG